MKYYGFYTKTNWAGSYVHKVTIKANSKKEAMKKFRKKHPKMKAYCIPNHQISIVPNEVK